MNEVRKKIFVQVQFIPGEERGAWQIVGDWQHSRYPSPMGKLPSPIASGISRMETPIGYNRAILFRTIVTRQISVGKTLHSIPDLLRHQNDRYTPVTRGVSRYDWKRIWVLSRRHLPLADPFLTGGENTVVGSPDPHLADGRYLQTGIFTNYSRFADRMYSSENTRKKIMEKIKRSADGYTCKTEGIHSSSAYPKRRMAIFVSQDR